MNSVVLHFMPITLLAFYFHFRWRRKTSAACWWISLECSRIWQDGVICKSPLTSHGWPIFWCKLCNAINRCVPSHASIPHWKCKCDEINSVNQSRVINHIILIYDIAATTYRTEENVQYERYSQSEACNYKCNNLILGDARSVSDVNKNSERATIAVPNVSHSVCGGFDGSVNFTCSDFSVDIHCLWLVLEASAFFQWRQL